MNMSKSSSVQSSVGDKGYCKTPEKFVQGEGFEPPKAYASRFTVCPRWPLGYPWCTRLHYTNSFAHIGNDKTSLSLISFTKTPASFLL